MRRSPLGPGSKALERGSSFKAAPKPLARRAPLNPISPRKTDRDNKPRRRSTLNPGRGFAASKNQREKVAAMVCAVCGAEHCDPAHLAPRAMGRGCDHRDCVIALCRPHHEQFDRGELDLLPHISGAGFERELAHMQGHYSDPLSVVFRLSGTRWVPEPKTSPEHAKGEQA